MEEIILRYLEVGGIIIAAIGAAVFGWKQYQINRRMQELSDYVAISIAPKMGLQLEIMNVGRSNLYIHKWEVGAINETFVKPLLLPTEARSKILITIQPPHLGQRLAKFYLTDENDRKYLSTGEIAIEPIAFQLPMSTTPPQLQQEPSQQLSGGAQPINVQLRMRAWSYKTIKYNWTI
jgi:hypothetical protein